MSQIGCGDKQREVDAEHVAASISDAVASWLNYPYRHYIILAPSTETLVWTQCNQVNVSVQLHFGIKLLLSTDLAAAISAISVSYHGALQMHLSGEATGTMLKVFGQINPMTPRTLLGSPPVHGEESC